MTQEVANVSGGAANVAVLQSLRQGLANVKETLVVKGGDPFLRMEKDGVWVYGADDTQVEEGSRWAVNPFSLEHGYACWTRHPESERKKNELLGERMVPMNTKKPDKTTLPQYAFDWTDQYSFKLRCTNGADEGQEVLFKTTSVGGTNAVNALIAAIMKQLDLDAGHPVPVLDLSNDSYNHKDWGKTYIPVFNVMSWATMEGEAAAPAAAPAAQAEAPAAAAPARQRRSSARPAAAVPVAGATPPAADPAMTQAVDPELVSIYTDPLFTVLTGAGLTPEVAVLTIQQKRAAAAPAAAEAPAAAAAPAGTTPAPARRRRAA